MFIGSTDAEAPITWRPVAKSQLIGKDPDDGKCWKQIRGQQMMRWLDSTTNSMDMRLSKLCKIVEESRVQSAAVHGIAKNLTWLNDWTKITTKHQKKIFALSSMLTSIWESWEAIQWGNSGNFEQCFLSIYYV